MKAKTVWRQWSSEVRDDDDCTYWVFDNKVSFVLNSDARWVNCFGYEFGGSRLFESSKIIGDLDE